MREKWINSSPGREFPYYVLIERVKGKHAKSAYHGTIYSEEIRDKGNALDFSLPHYDLSSDYADELACVLMMFTHVTADDWRMLRDFFEKDNSK